MKKQFILGMSLAMLVSTAMATGGAKMTSAQMDARISDQVAHSTQSGALRGVDYSDASKMRASIADALAKNNGSLDVESLKRAQAESITVDINGKQEIVSVGDLAKRTQMLNQVLTALKEARVELDAAAAAKVTAQEAGIKLNAEILAMSIARAAGAKPGSVRSLDMIKRDTAGHEKFMVEYTNVLETGSAKEIQSYNTLAQAMIDARTSASVTKDEAFDKAMTKVYGSKAEAKKKEMEGCVRG